LEVWERVLIDPEAYQQDVHSYIPCTDCHGGHDVPDKHAAHEGMVRDPSIDADASCGECHPDIAPYQEQNLHFNLAGYDTKLYGRSLPENHPLIEEGESYHCNNCHATCGQCHVSQPTSVQGGLLSGHVFERTPSMSRNCTACHGSRVKNEYTGAHEGLSPDVHLRSARMVCTDCHTAGDMHGTDYLDNPHNHRYDGAQSPTCESCHEDVVGVGSGNPYHEAHGTEILSCQVCHSVAYSNCYECHLDQTDEGVPYFQLQDEEIGFYIGRNPLRSPDRPYRFVPLRHVPDFPDLFAFYGDDILNNFDALPTWTYATPHNIQRNTPQTESCESCHGNDDIFLTPDKVRPEELQANASVIVLHAPPMPEDIESLLPGIIVGGEEGAGGTETGGAAPAATPTLNPLDVPPPTSSDPLDAPPVSSDPLDAPPASSSDPLDAPPVSSDPLDTPPATPDPLDAPPSS